jgi:sec-independent protein translocase protein TatC
MPETPEEWPEAGGPEDEGGPVKSFLEHLEDLRWVLIKSLAALGVGFVVCLVAGDKVMDVLMYPLRHAQVRVRSEDRRITFFFGTNRLGAYDLGPAQQSIVSALPTNQFLTLHLEPVAVRSESGTNYVLTVRPESNPEEGKRLYVEVGSTGPAGAFVVAVRVAVYAGGLLASPFIFYFIFSFVFPALKIKERKYVARGLAFGIGLFLTGVAFCYWFLMPVALGASVAYTRWFGLTVPLWRAEEYISFVCKFMLGMGLGFEMPVILLVLVKIGILNYRILSKARRYVIVINFILGAVLTTPEILTQVLMALPLQILYEITIWIAWWWERKERKRREVEELAGA